MIEGRPFRHVRERSSELKERGSGRLRRIESRLFDVQTLDGSLEILAVNDLMKGECMRSQPDVRRHFAALEVARRVLERRRRASTAPARLEAEDAGKLEEEDQAERGMSTCVNICR